MNKENYIPLFAHYTNEEIAQMTNCSRENIRQLRLRYNGRNVQDIYQERLDERLRGHYLQIVVTGKIGKYRHVDTLKAFALRKSLPWPPQIIEKK